MTALRQRLLPLATVVTPNLPEAEALAGHAVRTEAEIEEAARRIAGLGAAAVVVKGGHRQDAPVDVLYDGRHFHRFPAARVETRSTHGTGCTFAAAIAALLAQGRDLIAAVAGAKAYVTGALQHAQPLGRGHGPVAHDWLLERRALAAAPPE